MLWYPWKHSLSWRTTSSILQRLGSAQQLYCQFEGRAGSLHVCSEGISCFYGMFFQFRTNSSLSPSFSWTFKWIWKHLPCHVSGPIVRLLWTKGHFLHVYSILDSVAIETHSLAGRLCIPVGDCYKCAVSPLCVCVFWWNCFPFFFLLWECSCTSVFVCFLGEKVCFRKLCSGISDASSTFLFT